jgi:hypothetical protein
MNLADYAAGAAKAREVKKKFTLRRLGALSGAIIAVVASSYYGWHYWTMRTGVAAVATVLFFIGTGPVRGFAVTLGIGILTTVFTAFTLTRLIVATWVRARRPRLVPI